MNKKADLRNLYKKKRHLLNSEILNQITKNCVEQINSFDFKGKIVSVFLPIQKFNEIDTSSIIQRIIKKRKKLCIR